MRRAVQQTNGHLSRRLLLQRLGLAAGGGVALAALGPLGSASAIHAQTEEDDGVGDAGPRLLANGSVRLLVPFEIAVRQGPNAGLLLEGGLALTIAPSGAIDEGSFTLDDGSVIAVVGQTTGRALNLIFDLRERGLAYGVGTAVFDPRQATGPMGGPFVGPAAGDLGDWATTTGEFLVDQPSGKNYLSEATKHTIKSGTLGQPLTVLVGQANTPGNVDGVGTAARFNSPRGLGLRGNALYVADRGNQAIRRINTTTRAVTTVVGLAQARATVPSITTFGPADVAATADGNLYITDNANFVVWRYDGGVMRVFAGSPGQSGLRDGTGSVARFADIQDIQEGNGNSLLVSDVSNLRVRVIILPSGLVSTLGLSQ